MEICCLTYILLLPCLAIISNSIEATLELSCTWRCRIHDLVSEFFSMYSLAFVEFRSQVSKRNRTSVPSSSSTIPMTLEALSLLSRTFVSEACAVIFVRRRHVVGVRIMSVCASCGHARAEGVRVPVKVCACARASCD